MLRPSLVAEIKAQTGSQLKRHWKFKILQSHLDLWKLKQCSKIISMEILNYTVENFICKLNQYLIKLHESMTEHNF